MKNQSDKENRDARKSAEKKRPGSDSELGRFSERLQKVVGKGSVRGFAVGCGLSETGFRAYLAGNSEPGMSALVAIARHSGYSLEWLATGEGPEKVSGQVGEEPGGYNAFAAKPFDDKMRRMRDINLAVRRGSQLQPHLSDGVWADLQGVAFVGGIAADAVTALVNIVAQAFEEGVEKSAQVIHEVDEDH